MSVVTQLTHISSDMSINTQMTLTYCHSIYRPCTGQHSANTRLIHGQYTRLTLPTVNMIPSTCHQLNDVKFFTQLEPSLHHKQICNVHGLPTVQVYMYFYHNLYLLPDSLANNELLYCNTFSRKFDSRNMYIVLYMHMLLSVGEHC